MYGEVMQYSTPVNTTNPFDIMEAMFELVCINYV